MGFELMLFQAGFNHALLQKQAVNEVIKYNEQTARFGLILTEPQAIALVKTRAGVLRETGRIEFGGGIIDKIILAFCDSPYLTADNYEETLHELIEIFYLYKNETLDLISDDELIEFMKKTFDGICQGSLDLLGGRELEQLSRNFRYGNGQCVVKALAETNEEDEDELY